MSISELTKDQLTRFSEDGYVVVKGMVEPARCAELSAIAQAHLAELIAPVEYELDVHYPGSPKDADAPGARTSRRLLGAYARHDAFRRWATDARVGRVLRDLFGGDEAVMLSQCHHNCVMTKAPGFSSVTLWHQDNRYWSFDRQDLISVWLALGAENKSNGCLRVIPGTHHLQADPGRFDAALFLRPDLAENKALISRSQTVELDAGDVLFFHSRLLHAAGRNLTDATKFSAVFTYHQADNRPIRDTRSDRAPSISL